MINETINNMICIRCEETLPIGDYFTGCPHCLSLGKPASVIPHYGPTTKSSYRKLPYDTPTLLGEGNTPVIRLSAYANMLGLGTLYVKNEFQNPTGSHKDRMSKLFILHAKSQEAEGIVLASSGNAGLSVATYAANQHIPCCLITTKTLSKTMKGLIRNTGATIIEVDTPEERWLLTQSMVEKDSYYPCTNYISPPVGSNLWGVQGYKTISYELFEEFGNKLPTHILIPVSRGDLLWGVYEGFCDLKSSNRITKIPKLIAVEPIDRLSRVLSGEDYTSHFPGDYSYAPSIGGDTVTYQALKAIKDSKGMAMTVSKDEVENTLLELHHLGLNIEVSSTAPFVALKDLINSGDIKADDSPLIIATSRNFFIGDDHNE